MTTYTATYSPDDNKLRLTASARLDADTYARVKAAGFAWAPKQEQFIAPMWTPGRADLCIELAAEIEDDDRSLMDRAEERAERFGEYEDKRGAEAVYLAEHVRKITDGIPLGQPILVGHHSERHARKDAERIENGMRKAVKAFETSAYWKARAAGALRHAKYKEDPGVRHRRIKGLESDQRKQQKTVDDHEAAARTWQKIPRYEWDKQTAVATFFAGRISVGSYGIYSELSAGRMHGDTAWRESLVQCEAMIAHARRWLDHIGNRLEYERAMLGDSGGIAAEQFDIQIGGRVLIGAEWCVVLRINKSGGKVVSLTTTARYVNVRGIEEVKDYRAPEPEEVAKVAAVSKLAPLCNYRTDDCKEMTAEEWKRATRCSDSYFVDKIKATPEAVEHRHRTACSSAGGWKRVPVFLTDAKESTPAAPGALPKGRARGPWNSEPKAPAEPAKFERQIEPAALPHVPTQSAPLATDSQRDQFQAMRDSLKAGVKVVSAPQLFPTPPELAVRMVELANITQGDYVLEPSAGTGRLVDAILAEGHAKHITAVEINHALADGVRSRVDRLAVGDFLACSIATLGSHFHAILMNPPFAKGADVDHVNHALQFLAPGGRLVAIMSAGVSFRSDRKTRDFRALVERLGSSIEALPSGTFETSGTGVHTVLVVLEAPAKDAPPPGESVSVAAAPDYVATCGRWFRAVARFPEAEVDAANAYMEAHPGVGLLLIQGGELILAHRDDQGKTSMPADALDGMQPRSPVLSSDQVAAITHNQLRKCEAWADGTVTREEIMRAAERLETCGGALATESDGGALTAAYRAAVSRLRDLAAVRGDERAAMVAVIDAGAARYFAAADSAPQTCSEAAST